MVQEKEVSSLLLSLIEDLGQRRQSDKDPSCLRRRVAYLQTAVVPLLGQGWWRYPFDRFRYLRHACQGPGIVQSRIVNRLAERVSAATRLPLLAVPLFLAVGIEAAGTWGVLWALLCVFLTSGLSLIYLVYLNRSGKVSDPLAISRVERVRPLRVVAALHVAAFVIISLLGGPAELRAVLLSYALGTLSFALITPVSNLSLHAAGVSGAAVCLVYVFGAWGLPAFALLPLVFWARLALGRHTPFELALGALVGGMGTWISFHLIG